MSDDCKTNAVDQARRRLLSGAVAAAGLTLAPGVFLLQAAPAAAAAKAGSGVRWGLLVNTNNCSEDCNACVSACQNENGWHGHDRPLTDARWVRKLTLEDAAGRRRSLPVMCQHCEQPPCVYVCPTGASFKREDGVVLVDKHRCIGCRYCMMACPYQARSFVHEPVTERSGNHPRGKGTVEGCNLCVQRIDRGHLPACVEACSRQGGAALIFGDLNDPASAISQALAKHGGQAIRADLGLNPGVRYSGI